MLRKLLIAAAAFASIAVPGVMYSTPASAQPNWCLRNNRIWSWDVVGPNRMILMDRQRNRYEVRLSGGCFGLRENLFRVNFRTSTRLGCLRAGDRIDYRVPGFGRETCFIRSVAPLGGPRFGDRRDPWEGYRY
jgi:hypothetical protein